MTRPSDFRPSEVFEVPTPKPTKSVNDDVLKMRILGAVLLFMGWVALAVPDFGSPQFVLETAVLGALGTYAFVAAAKTRRTAVSLEKKLRLDLLVHNVELENMAMRDELTQLFNRRYFFERLERELQAAKGFQRPLCVVVIDLDSMKLVNDTYGHKVGDRALANFGAFLLDQTRASDVPSRIGGDEFAIILPDTDQRQASVLTERVLAALERTDLIDEDDVTLRLTASLGVAGCPWSGDSADELMQHADAAMYASKREHKANGVAAAVEAGPDPVRSTTRPQSVSAE